MPQNLNIGLKITPEFDVKKLNATLKAIKASMGDAGKSIQLIDEKKLLGEYAKIDAQAQKLAESMLHVNDETKKIVVTADGIDDAIKASRDEAKKLGDKLEDTFKKGKGFDTAKQQADAYTKAVRAADKVVNTHRKALALLELSGKKGTNEYKKLQTELRSSEQQAKKLKTAFTGIGETLQKAADKGTLLGKAFAFNQIVQATQALTGALQPFVQGFIDFDAGMADFSAITGVAGDALDDFGDRARALAKEFGTGVIEQVDAFKGILSRLGPDIAKSPEALEEMSRAVNTLSKASGLDAAASMDALTTAALQFNVDLSDPVKAAGEMTKMMNTMAAGAKEGAAEIPDISAAIVNAGVAASRANIPFEETNAAIQVLAAGGKYGAEAGVALRNVLGYLQKASRTAGGELKKMGLTTQGLGKTLTEKGLGAAIKDLKKGLNTMGSDAEKNTALMKLFGMENAAAAGILIKNADSIGELTKKLGGTNTAFDQAAINMDTAAAASDRFKAKIEDLALGAFRVLGTGAASTLKVLTEYTPALMGFMMLGQFAPGIKNTATALITKLVPAMVITDTATQASTLSFKALSKAMLSSPIFWVVAAIVGLVAAYAILHKSAEERAKDLVDEAKKEEEVAKRKLDSNRAKQEEAKRNIDLVNSYETMGIAQDALNKTTGKLTEQSEEHKKIIDKLIKTYPDAIDTSKSYKENVDALRKVQGELTEEQKEQVELNKKLIDEYEELGEKSKRTKEEQERYEEIIEILNGEYPEVIGYTSSFADEIERLKRESNYATGELNKLRAAMAFETKATKLATYIRFKKEADAARVKIDELIKDAVPFVGEPHAKGAVNQFITAIYKAANSADMADAVRALKNALYLGIKGAGDLKILGWDQKKIDENLRSMTLGFDYLKKSGDEGLKSITKGIDDFAGSLEKAAVVAPGGFVSKTSEFTKKWKDEIAKMTDPKEVEELAENFKGNIERAFKSDKATQDRLIKEFNQYFIDVLNKLGAGDGGDSGGVGGFDPDKDKKKIKDYEETLLDQRLKIKQRASKLIIMQMKDGKLKERAEQERKYEGELAGFDKQERMLKKKKDISENQRTQWLENINKLRKKAEEEHNIELSKIDEEWADKELKALEKQADDKVDIKEDELERLKALHDQEIENLKNKIALEMRLQEVLIGAVIGIRERKAVEEKEKEIKKLDELKEAEEISNKEHENRKEGIEKEHQKEMLKIRADARGMQLAIERQAQEKELQMQKDRLEKERAFTIELINQKKARIDAAIKEEEAEKIPNKERIKQMKKSLQELDSMLTKQTILIDIKLNEINLKIGKVGDVLSAYSEELQQRLAETFLALFSGATEATREGATELLALIGGILKKEALAFIMGLSLSKGVLATVSALPFPLNIIAHAGIVAALTAAINAIVDPVINTLTSFSGGGRFDEPTKVVGDNPYSPEWVFRDIDIMAMLDKQMNSFLDSMPDILNSTLDKYFSDSDITQQDMMKWSTNIRDLGVRQEKIDREIEKMQDIMTEFKLKISTDTKGFFEELDKTRKINLMFLDNKITEDEYYKQIKINEIGIDSSATKDILNNLGMLKSKEIIMPDLKLDTSEFAEMFGNAVMKGQAKTEKLLVEVIAAIYSMPALVQIDGNKMTDKVNQTNRERSRRHRLQE